MNNGKQHAAVRNADTCLHVEYIETCRVLFRSDLVFVRYSSVYVLIEKNNGVGFLGSQDLVYKISATVFGLVMSE